MRRANRAMRGTGNERVEFAASPILPEESDNARCQAILNAGQAISRPAECVAQRCSRHVEKKVWCPEEDFKVKDKYLIYLYNINLEDGNAPVRAPGPFLLTGFES